MDKMNYSVYKSKSILIVQIKGFIVCFYKQGVEQWANEEEQVMVGEDEIFRCEDLGMRGVLTDLGPGS